MDNLPSNASRLTAVDRAEGEYAKLPPIELPQLTPEEAKEAGPVADKLPAFRSAADISPKVRYMAEVTYPTLIEGLLHKKTKMVIGGSSKAYKSWALLHMACALAGGGKWMGKVCTKCRVLYIGFELLDLFAEDRVNEICKATELNPGADMLMWHLRWKCYDIAVIKPIMEQRFKESGFIPDVIIVDPIYKAYGDLEENSATEMGILTKMLESLADSLGAAIVYAAHYSKGNQSEKEAIDRISGSGVHGRDADTLLLFTQHEEEDCFTATPVLRHFPRLGEWVVRWKHPVFVAEDGLDPQALRKPGRKRREDAFDAGELLKALPDGGATSQDWQKTAEDMRICKRARFFTASADLLKAGRVKRFGALWVKSKPEEK